MSAPLPSPRAPWTDSEGKPSQELYRFLNRVNAGSSTPGPKGDKGDTGDTGPQGIPGTNGTNGTNGINGINGADGATGATGPGVATGGTAGQFLRKQSGTDFDTAWAAIAISEVTALQAAIDTIGLKLVSSGTASAAATVDVTLPTGYREFQFRATRLEPATAGSVPWVRVSYDSGATYKNGALEYLQESVKASSGGVVGAGPAGYQTAIVVGEAQAAGGNNSKLALDITNQTAGYYTQADWKMTQALNAGGGATFNGGVQLLAATGRVTNIRLLYSAGNVASVDWQLYGYRN